MAINLNLETYGAQFNAFVEFANENANNADALACIGADETGARLDPEGKVRTIVAKTDDDKIKRFQQNLFFRRNADQARLNNAVRDLFKETVLKVCGVETIEKLPPSVLAVMKKNDYDNNGHPLSVRRILAVTNAIKNVKDSQEQAAVDAKQTVLPSYAKYGNVIKATVDRTVQLLGDAVEGDELSLLDEAELKRLEEKAPQLDVTEGNYSTLYYDSAKFKEVLDNFSKKVSAAMDELYTKGAGSPTMTAIRTNILIQYSVRKVYSVNSLSNIIDRHFSDLPDNQNQLDIMANIVAYAQMEAEKEAE